MWLIGLDPEVTQRIYGAYVHSVNNKVFHKLHDIGNNVNIGIRGYRSTTWKQKIQ